MSCMHPDARIMVTGGVGLCLPLLVLGATWAGLFAWLGFALNAGGLLGAMVIQTVAGDPPP